LAKLQAAHSLDCGDSSPLSLGAPLTPVGSRSLYAPSVLSPGLPTEARSCAESSDEGEKKSAMNRRSPKPQTRDWPHAPLHRLSEHGTYMVTAGTLHREHWFRGPERLDMLETALLNRASEFGWQLEAWAVFSNHYHFVAHWGPGGRNLRDLIKQLHGETSHQLNELDGVTNRQVWHNFWDTALTFEKSYLARLNYVHHNAVRHGIVRAANQYRWCSAAWFERTATPAQVSTLYSFKIDKVRVPDDFDPL
jgi:putative transposase